MVQGGKFGKKELEKIQAGPGPGMDGVTLCKSRGVWGPHAGSVEEETNIFYSSQGGEYCVGSQMFCRLLWMGMNIAGVSMREVGN